MQHDKIFPLYEAKSGDWKKIANANTFEAAQSWVEEGQEMGIQRRFETLVISKVLPDAVPIEMVIPVLKSAK